MIPRTCLLIESSRFPILEGEKQELVNDGMFGKALCTYLQERLPPAGLPVPFFCNEDWGWWLQTERNGFRLGLCIYSDPGADADPERYALMPSLQSPRQWSWSRFRWIDRSEDVLAFINSLADLRQRPGDPGRHAPRRRPLLIVQGPAPLHRCGGPGRCRARVPAAADLRHPRRGGPGRIRLPGGRSAGCNPRRPPPQLVAVHPGEDPHRAPGPGLPRVGGVSRAVLNVARTEASCRPTISEVAFELAFMPTTLKLG